MAVFATHGDARLAIEKQTQVPVVRTTAYTAAVGDYVEASGTFTVTLPTPSLTGSKVAVVNTGTGTITVAGTGAATINGDANATLVSKGAGGEFFWDGTGWWVALAGLKGDTGPAGPAGPKGDTGEQGPAGTGGGGGGALAGYGLPLIAGRYAGITTYGFGGPAAMTADELVLVPVYFSRAAPITSIGAHVWSAGSAGTVLRFVLLGESAGLPSAVLAEGTVAGTTSGLVKATVSYTPAVGVQYFVGVAVQGGPATKPEFLTLTGNTSLQGNSFLQSEVGTPQMYDYGRAGTTGAVPNPIGAIGRASTLVPRLFIGS